MARIIPSDLTRLALAGAHGPEIATLARLRDALPEDYTVFHGVHWTRQYRGRTLYGEIDFVILNRAGQILCIEQKNGPLEESQGEPFKTYGDTRKSVGAQILRAIDGIRDKIAHQLGAQSAQGTRPAIEYLIYCPDHSLRRLAAVILTDVDPRPGRLTQELQILFCGMTRATVRLEILCTATNPWVSARLLAAGGG